jgi:hypothetical protein
MATNYGPAPLKFGSSKSGYNFKPISMPTAVPLRNKPKGWANIEAATGKKFKTYQEAVDYANKSLLHGSNNPVAGLVGNLGHDVVDMAQGFLPGLWQMASNPTQAAKDIGSSYKNTYGGLFTGHASDTLHNIYQHPLGPILDAASIVTFGAGAGVKGAALAGRLGSKSAILAKVADAGKGGTLLARNEAAIRAGDKAIPLKIDKTNLRVLSGNARILKHTSSNPVIRLKQNLVYSAKKNLPGGIGHNYELKRYAKESASETLRTAGRRQYAGVGANVKYTAKWNRLSKPERVALSMLGRYGDRAHPRDVLAQHIATAAREGKTLPQDAIKALSDPKMHKAYEDAVTAARTGDSKNKVLQTHRFAEQLGRADAGIKRVEPLTAENRIWKDLVRHNADNIALGTTFRNHVAMLTKQVRDELIIHHQQTGARYPTAIEVKKIVEGKLAQEAKRLTEPLAAKDGKMIRDTGHVDPIYMPDKTATENTSSRIDARGAGIRKPGTFILRNRNVVAEAGKVAHAENLLSKEFGKTLHTASAHDTYNTLMDAAIAVPTHDMAAMGQKGYEVLRNINGDKGFMAKHDQASLNALADGAGSLERAKMNDVFTTSHVEAAKPGAQVAKDSHGNYMMVRKSQKNIITQQYFQSSDFVRNFINKPMKLWKYVVLGLSPRNIATNVVGNTIMAALMSHSPKGAAKIIMNSARGLMPTEAIRESVMFKHSGALSQDFMHNHLGEQVASSFTHGELDLKNKLARRAAVGYNVVHNHEMMLRRGMGMELVKNNRLIQREYKHLLKFKDRMGQSHKRGDRTWEKAANNVIAKHPDVVDEISRRIDDALGNYRDFSKNEQWARQIMPFYSWYRHATRTALAGTDKPTTLAAANQVSKIGNEAVQKNLGDVPDFMRQMVGIGKKRTDANGDVTQKMLDLKGLNPFSTIADIAQGGRAALVDKNFTGASSKLTGVLNPFGVAAAESLTGKSLLSGAPSPSPNIAGKEAPLGYLGDTIARVVAGTTPGRMLTTQFGNKPNLIGKNDKPTNINQLSPTGTLKKQNTPAIGKDLGTLTTNLLGFPAKDVNITRAQDWKKQINLSTQGYHVPKSRIKKPRKPKLWVPPKLKMKG